MIKISILCHDMSNNCLGRAYILARALQRNYTVEIVGPAAQGQIWEPLRNDTSVPYKILTFRNVLSQIEGDVIYASKTKGTSFGYGLFQRVRFKKPLILDIDDWDYGLQIDGKLHQKLYDAARFWNTNNLIYTWLFEHLTKLATAITVSNTFLKDKFGGELIPHFRDTSQFDPSKFNQKTLKDQLNLSGKKVILFLGTPRRHKGINDLVDATERLKRKDVILLVVGATTEDKKSLPDKPFLRVLGRQPFDEIPKFLAVSDLIVLFQSASKSAQGQLPAKVFDAMSMAKPVIASSVSDLPKILEGCGSVVAPGEVGVLAENMSYLLDHPDYAHKLGSKAREKCIREYSYDALAPKLHQVVEDVLAKTRRTATM